MIAMISAFGVLGLIGLRLFSFWQDRPEEGFKKFLAKEMTRTGAEFLAILLSVTIGLNLGEVQQNQQQKEQIRALLEVSVGEIESSLALNATYLQPFEKLKEGQTVSETAAGMAKSNAKCNVATIEKILDMESVMATISPGAYHTMCNCIDNAQLFYNRLQTLDYKTQSNEIGMHLRSVNLHLEMLISMVDLELCHLRGELTSEQVTPEFRKRWIGSDSSGN